MGSAVKMRAIVATNFGAGASVLKRLKDGQIARWKNCRIGWVEGGNNR